MSDRDTATPIPWTFGACAPDLHRFGEDRVFACSGGIPFSLSAREIAGGVSTGRIVDGVVSSSAQAALHGASKGGSHDRVEPSSAETLSGPVGEAVAHGLRRSWEGGDTPSSAVGAHQRADTVATEHRNHRWYILNRP